MGILKGFDGSIKAGSTPTTVGEVKNYSLEISSDVVETSTLGSAWAKNDTTLKRWSGSLVAHFDVTDSGIGEFRSGIVDGTKVDLVLYAGGESGAGNISYGGTAVVNSFSIANDVAGIVEVSISFTGDGTLTETELS